MNTKKDNTGHRSRIKNKYMQTGFDGWAEYEILELLLTLAIPRRDTKQTAKDMLNEFGSLTEVINADISDIKKIKGAGENVAFLLKILKDTSSIYLKNQIFNRDIVKSPQAVFDYLQVHFTGLKKESFMVLFLNSANEITAHKSFESGTVNQAIVFPREITAHALKTHAVSVILAHNHPSGNTNPSSEDITLTKKIKAALKTVDIALLDHLIISRNNYLSLKSKNLF